VKPTNPQGTDTQPLAITETVLRNLRVLATDQTTQTELTPEGKSVVKIAHDVTLEVTPRIAEKIEVAQTLGTLSLSLRALADDQSELDQALPGGKVKRQDQDRMGPLADNRPVETATSFATGGDVSRFARRSLPVATRSPVPAGAMPIGPMVRVTRGSAETAVPIGMPGLAGWSGPPAGMQPMQAGLAGGE
jgi:pilus assembly protein CpaB